MERSVGARGAASASESVLTGAAISEYDRCALQMPGNSATQLVSLCSMACSQHSSTLSSNMDWLRGVMNSNNVIADDFLRHTITDPRMLLKVET